MSLIDRITNYIKVKSLALSLAYDNHFYADADHYGWTGNVLNIYYAAKEGEDISPAVSALMKVDSLHPNKALAGKAIVHHYLNTSDWEGLNKFLENGPKHLLLGGMEVLGEDCENGLDISNLIPADIIKKLISHEYVDIRKNSVKMISAMKNPPFNELIELLDGPHAMDNLSPKDAVFSAINALAEKGTDISAIVPKLMELSHNKDHRIRSNAAISLGKTGNPEYIPKLIGLLKGPVPEVRYFAAEALVNIAEKTCEKEDKIPALKIIKRITASIRESKGRSGLIYYERRHLLNSLGSMLERIKEKMDVDKKFPVKRNAKSVYKPFSSKTVYTR